MKIKIARNMLNAKPSKTIDIETIEKNLDKTRFYYFDRENEHKDMLALKEHFEEKGFSVQLKDVHYALDEAGYLYEMHIL